MKNTPAGASSPLRRQAISADKPPKVAADVALWARWRIARLLSIAPVTVRLAIHAQHERTL